MDEIKGPIIWLVIIAAAAAFYYSGGSGYVKAKYAEMFPPAHIDTEYEAFRKGLDKDCPYYEPNGFRYRECLTDLLNKRNREVADTYGQLYTDLNTITDPELVSARDAFKKDLMKLSFEWITYSDYLCKAQADRYWGGSDQGGELSRCKLYETEKYMTQLKQFREDWL